MAEFGLCINPGKNEVVGYGGNHYLCRAIKTKVITENDSLAEIVAEYAKPHLREGDVLFLSEKMVACAQGRAIPLSSITPGFLARLLSRFVTKSEAGIGLSMPETMQCAIGECGCIRIFLAAAIGMLGKLCRQKGWFYHIAGYRAACIDGPCGYTIPPYDRCVVLAPLDPERTASSLAKILDEVVVMVVDANDLGVRILGSSEKIDQGRMLGLLRQNPLGQSGESTPMGILRPLPQGY